MFIPPPDLSSDIEWMLQSGQVSLDVLAETLVDAWYPLIFQFAFSTCEDEEESRQVAIHTFVSALLGMHRYKNDSNIQKWLLQFAVQEVESRNSQNRKKTRQSERRWNRPGEQRNSVMDLRASQLQPDPDEIKITWQVVASCPIEDRLAALLYYQFNYGYEDIAEILKCEVHTVHFRLQKSRSRLRRELEASGLRNATLKTGYLESLIRKTCQVQRRDPSLTTNQRGLLLQEIVRLVKRRQNVRRAHISAQVPSAWWSW